MAIWLDHRSKVIVQGMTGTEGRKHTNRMLMFGTRIVAGVTPGKGGQSVTFEEDPIPVFNTVAEAAHATGANVSVIFVPPPHAKAAVLDAIAAGIELVVVITEGIPVADTAEFYAAAQDAGVRLLGPNCPGIISPGRSNVGIIPPSIARSGHIGLVSKSGTLTYQMMFELGDVGFSTAVGIGGDPIIGTTHIDCLRAFAGEVSGVRRWSPGRVAPFRSGCGPPSRPPSPGLPSWPRRCPNCRRRSPRHAPSSCPRAR